MDNIEERVWAEIYLDRLVNNYKIIKQKASRAKIMAAIKADAYGHGAVEVAQTLAAEGVYMFGVASVEEGVELRRAGISSKILILSPTFYSQIDAILEYKLIPTVSELGFFDALNKKAQRLHKPILVHIEVDTGMTRTGIPYNQAIADINKISSSRFIKIEGIFSHFPLADSDGSFTRGQIKKFSNLVKKLKNAHIMPQFLHLANSAGVFKYPNSHFNLIRPGIALYGLNPSPTPDFSAVMALKSKIVNIRDVPANTPISYGHTFITKRKSKIATVSIGYGDGLPRVLSNCGEVLLRGQRVPIVGTICMDLMMIDITDISEVKLGDVVTIIGKDGNAEITAEECAQRSRTIVYEITSGIGPRVARVFKHKDRVVGIRNLLTRWKYDEGPDCFLSQLSR